ncbi:hypothetical protein Tco_1171715, partial [Tanacetum coccineum]
MDHVNSLAYKLVSAMKVECSLLNQCKDQFSGLSLLEMNLASCKKLTNVCYQGKGLADLSSNFPFLEDLFLVLPDECERLNVSSHSLRTFMLHSKCELDKINVDALNLLLFGFTDHLRFYSPKETILDPIVSIKSEVIQWPPIEFEHVELEAEWFEYKSMYELVVDSLLWCCRPQSLTLIIDFSLLKFEEWESVVKHTHKKLLEQEDQAHTNIQFVMSSSSSKDKMNFSDLSTLLKALPRNESKQRITFIKYRSCSRSRKRKPSKVSESNRDDGNDCKRLTMSSDSRRTLMLRSKCDLWKTD